MQPISHQSLTELLAPRRQPCISIYQPTHRAAPPAEEDAVRFRDNVDRLHEILSERYDSSVVRELVQKVNGVAADPAFCEGDRDGIAIFVSADFVRVIELKRDPTHPSI